MHAFHQCIWMAQTFGWQNWLDIPLSTFTSILAGSNLKFVTRRFLTATRVTDDTSRLTRPKPLQIWYISKLRGSQSLKYYYAHGFKNTYIVWNMLLFPRLCKDIISCTSVTDLWVRLENQVSNFLHIPAKVGWLSEVSISVPGQRDSRHVGPSAVTHGSPNTLWMTRKARYRSCEINRYRFSEINIPTNVLIYCFIGAPGGLTIVFFKNNVCFQLPSCRYVTLMHFRFVIKRLDYFRCIHHISARKTSKSTWKQLKASFSKNNNKLLFAQWGLKWLSWCLLM